MYELREETKGEIMEPTTWLIVKFVNGRPEIASRVYDDRYEMQKDFEAYKEKEPTARVYEIIDVP